VGFSPRLRGFEVERDGPDEWDLVLRCARPTTTALNPIATLRQGLKPPAYGTGDVVGAGFQTALQTRIGRENATTKYSNLEFTTRSLMIAMVS